MLRYKADLRTLAFVTIYYIMVVMAWFYWPSTWYLKGLIVAVISIWSFFCAVITHNTIHAPIFKKKWMNKAFQVILSFTYGHSVSAYVPGHNFSHHRYTQSAKDRIRSDKMRFKWNFLNQFLFFFRMAPGIVKDEIVFSQIMLREKPQWYAQYALELACVLGIKFALLVVDWQRALLILFIPHLYAAWGIVGTNFWQHDGCDAEHPHNHSRNFTSPWLNFFAFNNGYHGAHHDKPNLHWSLLPAYHQEHIVPNIHPNLNRYSLVAYLWEICIWPGKRLDYLGNPVILPPVREDEDWIDRSEISKDTVSLGVEQ